jgi:hypothetical protein
MISKLKTLSAWLVIMIIILMGVFTVEAAPSLVNIGVGTKGKIVVINARLLEGFTDSIEEAIESGVPITFTFEAELRQVNDFWQNTLISTNTISHTIKYDSLKKVYRFTELGKGVKRKIATRNKQKYQQMMLTLENIPISSARRLNFNEKYYVRIKASLEMDRFWFPFNHLFFFLPFDSFNAAWTESSPLSIDPDLAFARDNSSLKDRNKNKRIFGGTKHVVRSFNK